jgi:tight adherence protein B
VIINPLLLTLLTFVAAVTAVVAVASVVSDLFLRDRARVSLRIDDEFHQKQRERARRSLLFKDLGRVAAEFSGDHPPLRSRVETLIDQAGLELTVERLALLSAVAAAGLAALAGLLGRDPVAAAVGAAVGAPLPLLFVLRKRSQRMRKILEQLPDALDLMGRVIRAGQTMSQAQQAVADEFSPPIAAEFSYSYEQQNLGLAPEVALRDLARRTGLLEIRIFVTALLVQQQTGGNLSELLENLSAIVRERFKMQGKIKALTAEGRYQGLVLLLLPVFLYLIMLLMNREFAGVLLEYPMVLLAVGVSEAIGAYFIHKIVNFDF